MVVDAQTGERANWRRILARVAVYIVLANELATLIGWWLAPGTNEVLAALLPGIVSIAAGVILLSPMFMGQGVRMLQDLASGTLVVARHGTTKRLQLVPTAPLKLPSAISATGWPARMGPFDVRGVIWQSAHFALLVADDSALKRSVWLIVEPRDHSSGTKWRRQGSRVTRLRWLDGGESGQWIWNAFVAPSGAPLRYWVSPQLKFTWMEARSILEQVIDEFQHSRELDQPLTLHGLDQLWLDTQGRTLLSDVPLDDSSLAGGPSASTNPQFLSGRETRFVVEAMRMCLTGKSLPLDVPPEPIAAPLPGHARQMLAEMVQKCAEPQTDIPLADLKLRLRESANRPANVTQTIRLWMIGVSAFTLLGLSGAMTSLTRIGNQVTMIKLSDAWIEFTALQQVISDDKLYQLWQAAAPPSAVNDSLDRAAVAESLHQAAREIEQRIRQRWVHIGSLQRRILEGNVTVPILDAGPTLRFEASTAEPAMLKMLAGLNGRPGPDIAFAKLHERYEQHRNNRPIVTERNIRLSFLVANLPLLVLIAWCAVTRGGLPYLLLGVRIVRENGRPAGLWLLSLRSALTWLPFVVLCSLVVAIDLFAPQIGWLASVLHVGMLGLLLLYAAIALRWPDRVPQDWILGTTLVPG